MEMSMEHQGTKATVKEHACSLTVDFVTCYIHYAHVHIVNITKKYKIE